MISESEAIQKILEQSDPLGSETLPLLEALNRGSAKNIFASIPYPPFDQSSMDGYAIHHEDSFSIEPLKVIGEQPAGIRLPFHVGKGQALRIFTGAPMPTGATAVIMQEDTQLLESNQILCTDPVEGGENIRVRGAEIAQGQKGISDGEPLTAARLSWLASQGRSQVEATRLPKIAIISTGDELAPLGQPLQEGQVYESNSLMLAAMCKTLGFSHAQVFHCADRLSCTEELIRELQLTFDLLIFSGGVSVGDHDHVKPALSSCGYDTQFWRVAIKPGKPLIFATQVLKERKVLAFGLPGNPVSSWVTFVLFVKPCLLKLAGHSEAHYLPKYTSMPLAAAVENPDRRTHYLRGIQEGNSIRAVGNQASHALSGLSQATHLIRVPPKTELSAQTLVETLPIL